MSTLTEEMHAVVDNLKARDWIQGSMQRGEAVCAHGAVKTCQGLRPGDEHIIRAVMRTKGVTEDWNDEDGRTKQDVVAAMSLIEVSDADLQETFGPAWRMVIAVIRRSAILTAAEAKDLAAARDAAWAAARYAARAAARDAARDAAWAAVVSDLVGHHGLTQEHVDTLMAPWVQVLGDNWAEGLL